MNQVDVAIIGAGPTGLFLARELHRHGIAAAIYERKEEACQISSINLPFIYKNNYFKLSQLLTHGAKPWQFTQELLKYLKDSPSLTNFFILDCHYTQSLCLYLISKTSSHLSNF